MPLAVEVSDEVSGVRLKVTPPIQNSGNADLDFIANADKRMADWMAAMKANVAQATAEDLGIPPLLETMRQAHLIPTGAFACTPCFDWVYLYQVAREDKEELNQTYAGSSIFMPETVKAAKKDEACRGVLVAAGPRALDYLRTNGIELGHVVRFCKFTPFRLLADVVMQQELWILALRCESIAGSETLEQERRAKHAEVVWDNTSQMHYVERYGQTVGAPKTPWSDVNQDVM